jgi:hypothetical protein
MTQEIRVQNAFDDVASTTHESLAGGPAVKPVKGDALLFYDLDLRNGFEPSGLHAGCPVLQGVKAGRCRLTVSKWVLKAPMVQHLSYNMMKS